MNKKKTNKPAGKSPAKITLNTQKAVQDLVNNFQKENLKVYASAAEYMVIKDHSVFEYARLGPYCLAAIGHGVGFQKENPVEGIRAFALSIILSALEFQTVEFIETSTKPNVLEGCVSFKFVNGKKELMFNLYCEYQPGVDIIEFIQELKE
jgi:hypothetical protein